MMRHPFARPTSPGGILQSLGAAFLISLAIVMLAVALPNPCAAPSPPAALTSGGKFSARVPGLMAGEPARTALPPILIESAERASAGGSLMSHLLPQ